MGHTREKLTIPARIEVRQRQKPKAPPSRYQPYAALESGLLDGMPAFGQGYNLLIDGQLHYPDGNRAGHDPLASGRLMERLCRKITDHADELLDVDAAYLDDAQTVVVSYGSVARSALSAVKMARQQGLKVGFVKLKIIWPFPDRFIRDAIATATKVVVPEMNVGKISRELERLTSDGQEISPVPKLGGNLHTPNEIFRAISS